MSDTTRVSSSLPTTEKLRDLDGFEEFFYLIEQRLSRLSVLIGEVQGITDPAQWDAAALMLQRRIPLLAASIEKRRGKRPAYIASHQPLLVKHVPLDGMSSLEEEMQRELRCSFRDASGLLARITVFHGNSRSVVLLATHHAAFDGTSNLMIMRDLLAAVAGEDLVRPKPVQLGLSSLFALKGSPSYSRVLPDSVSVQEGSELVAESDGLSAHVTQIDADLTRALLLRSREERTTIHGALLTALITAGRRISRPWREANLSTFSPVDVRGMLGLSETLGVLFALHPIVFRPKERLAFWDSARSIKESLRVSQEKEGALGFVTAVQALLRNEETPKSVYATALIEPLAHELMLTNYGAYKMRTDYGRLRLESLYSGGGNGSPTTQKVSAITLHGKINLTLVSQSPFPSLLEDTKAILLRSVE